MSFFVINPDATYAFVDDTTLAAKQKAVGGYIGFVSVRNARALDIYVNEEGLLRGLEPNPLGSAVARACGFSMGFDLAGPVIVSSARNEGAASLDVEQKKYVQGLLETLVKSVAGQ